MAFSNQQLRAIRDGAHPQIVEFEEALVKKMAAHGVPMWAHAVVRTKKQQEAAFAGGFSKARFGKSPHNFGCAVDLVHGLLAWGLDPKAWNIIGHIGKELALSKQIAIVWGGDWKRKPTDPVGWDPAHWELRDWKTLRTEYPWKSQAPIQTPKSLSLPS